MGVPKLFRWLSNKYSEIIEKPNQSNEFDVLFFDLNSLIHPVCHGLTNENEMFIKIKEYIIYIVNIVKPKDSVYCVMDGVAPYAKILQQRQRRYKSIELKRRKMDFYKKYNINYQKEWDSNAISPGTLFMKKLSEYLKNELNRVEIQGNKIKWFINDTFLVGEGEHKIMEILLNDIYFNTKSKYKVINVCIYGMDADLILLSWCLYLRKNINISLIRENQITNNRKKSKEDEKIQQFIYLHIPILIKCFLKEYYKTDDIENYKQICYDFIYLTIFVGNDFLPPLFGINISSGGIEYLLNIYNICKSKNELFHLIEISEENKTNDIIDINYSFLLQFLIELDKVYESKIIPEFYLEYLNYEPKNKMNYNILNQLTTKKYTESEKKQINREYNEIETIFDKTDPIDLCNQNEYLNIYYYERYFDIYSIDCEYSHNTIIENYLSGFKWVIDYYTKFYLLKKNTISFGFHYNYLQSPLLKNIIKYLENMLMKNINFNTRTIYYLNEPYVPYYPFSVYQALTLILPKESYYLIPKGFIEKLNKELLDKYIYNKENEKIVYVKDYKIFYSECNIILEKINYKKFFNLI